MNIKSADDDVVDQFHNEVNIILNTLGHPDALVTDESTLYDFLPMLPSNMLVSTIPLLELMEMKRQGRMDEFMKPVEYTSEDEAEVQDEIDDIMQAVAFLFVEYEIDINPSFKIGELARILHSGQKKTIH